MPLGLKDWTEPLSKQERAELKEAAAYERKLEEHVAAYEVALRDVAAIEQDLREQAVGEQCGVLLELANRLRAALAKASTS